jgi:hypothetical protein
VKLPEDTFLGYSFCRTRHNAYCHLRNSTVPRHRIRHDNYPETGNCQRNTWNRSSYTGNGVLNGVNITINCKSLSTDLMWQSIPHGWYLDGRNGSDRMSTYTFLGIEHYGTDGKLRGTIFDTVKATGKLAFLSKVIVIDKHEVAKAGNIISKFSKFT